MASYTSIYIIRLENGKRFVGTSDDPEKALIAHREGGYSAWTDMYKPIRMEKIYNSVPSGHLDQYVIQCMAVYGIENVRGGSWFQPQLTNQQRREVYTRTVKSRRACCIQ